MTDEPSGTCTACQRRDPQFPPVCEVCRSRMPRMLGEIPELCALLVGLGFVERDGRYPRVCYPDDHDHAGELVPHLDRVANVFPAGPIAGRSSAPRVSGSRDRGAPARLDLLGPADLRTVHDEHGDQVGHVSVASVLGSWAREWAEIRDELGPDPTVQALCRWMRDRIGWACDKHPAVDEFARELHDVHLTLRRANGLTEQQPEPCVGVPCRAVDCDLKTLYRIPGSIYIECASCGLLLTEDEYAAWLRLLTARRTVVRQP
jgi:hypothetical protein